MKKKKDMKHNVWTLCILGYFKWMDSCEIFTKKLHSDFVFFFAENRNTAKQLKYTIIKKNVNIAAQCF